MEGNEYKELADLEREFRRVGITWQTFATLVRQGAPNSASSPNGSLGLGLDVAATVAVLRTLPDGVGEAAFVDAFKARFGEPAERRAQRARRAEDRNRLGSKPEEGEAGA
jgi:hypothetical protein